MSYPQAMNMEYIPLMRDAVPGVKMAAFTRFGGISKPPFDTNNISFGVGDDHAAVHWNRGAIKHTLGLDYLISAHQIHGDKVHRIVDPVEMDYIADGYDALITNISGVGLLIGHADCQAVLVYDSLNHVIAAIHSGWRGSVTNIIEKTIAEMNRIFSSDPAHMIVGVGPSLGPCCSEFVNYKDELPASFEQFQIDEYHFDFWQITKYQLLQCGVKHEAISFAGICTSCSSEYYSYRRSRRQGGSPTGRNGSVIALMKQE